MKRTHDTVKIGVSFKDQETLEVVATYLLIYLPEVLGADEFPWFHNVEVYTIPKVYPKKRSDVSRSLRLIQEYMADKWCESHQELVEYIEQHIMGRYKGDCALEKVKELHLIVADTKVSKSVHEGTIFIQNALDYSMTMKESIQGFIKAMKLLEFEIKSKLLLEVSGIMRRLQKQDSVSEERHEADMGHILQDFDMGYDQDLKVLNQAVRTALVDLFDGKPLTEWNEFLMGCLITGIQARLPEVAEMYAIRRQS